MQISRDLEKGAEVGAVICEAGQAERLAEMLKALAHPVRLRIVGLLCINETEHVSGLAEVLRLPQSIVSQQLRILRMRGLVVATRHNGFAYYRIAVPRLRDLVRCMEGCSAG